jgi:hypothetical protein
MDNKKLTSVRVEQELFEEFKVQCVRYKFSFQKLADRAIFLYLTDDSFRNKLHSQNDLNIK